MMTTIGDAENEEMTTHDKQKVADFKRLIAGIRSVGFVSFILLAYF
jgi:hypothetical protein